MLVSLRTFSIVTIITLPQSSDSFISQIRAASEQTTTPKIVTKQKQKRKYSLQLKIYITKSDIPYLTLLTYIYTSTWKY